MKVPLYKIFQFFLMFSISLLIGYYKVFSVNPGFYSLASVCIFLGGFIVVYILTKQKNYIRQSAEFAIGYLKVYMVIIIASIYVTMTNMDYELYDIWKVSLPYLYIYGAIILIYIFNKQGIEKSCDIVSGLVNGMLIIKTVCWLLFNYWGITIFPNILLQYEGWLRDGMQRLDTGFLYFVALVWNSYKASKGWNKKSYAWLGFYVFFVVFVARFRFLLIVTLITIFVTCYFSIDKKNNIVFIRVSIFLMVLGAVIFGFFDNILELFSISGTYGTSSLHRLGTLYHYYDLMVQKKAIFGIGLIDTAVKAADEYMLLGIGRDGVSYYYYIDDIGILGGIVRFGVMSLIVYVPLFVQAVRVFIRHKKGNTKYVPFLAGVCTYLLLSCTVLNIFDSQRALDTPFYLAFISYFGGFLNKDKSIK